MKTRSYPGSPSFIVGSALLALALLLAGTGFLLHRVLPGELVEVATIAGWRLDATHYGIGVNYNNRGGFTVLPLSLAPFLGLIAGALFLRNDLNYRDTRKRGFDISEPK